MIVYAFVYFERQILKSKQGAMVRPPIYSSGPQNKNFQQNMFVDSANF